MKTALLLLALMLATCETSPAQVQFKSDTAKYLHVAHLENWFVGTVPPDSVPYQYITDLIMFDGFTFGKLTNPTPPYFGMPTDLTVDPWGQGFPQYWAKVIRLAHLNGVKMIIDLGQNSQSGGGGFYQLCNLGLGAMQTWAGTVAHALIQFNFDGGDFDAEGGQYPLNGGMGKMAQLLRDSLLSLNPSKHYDITCSMMPNVSDVQGYLTGFNGAAASLVTQASAAFDIISPMWYDQSFPLADPLFKSSTHSCWSNDSDRAQAFERAGIPKNKIGIGYAIQVYDGCASCLSYFNQVIKYYPGSTTFTDDEAKATWFTGNGHTIAFENDYTGSWKANFVQRKSLRGIMGFCIGRGYLPAAGRPAGWDANPAVSGVGKTLYGNVPFVIDTTHVVDTTHPPVVVRPKLLYFELVDTATLKAVTGPIANGSVLSASLFKHVSLHAVDSGGIAQSFAFIVNGNQYLKNGSGLYGWSFKPVFRINSAMVTAWSGQSATGAASPTFQITFTVVSDSVMNPPPMPQCFSQAQLDSTARTNFAKGAASVVCATCPDTAGIRAAAYLQGKRDEWDLIPAKPPRP